jgi:hypothetical protein
VRLELDRVAASGSDRQPDRQRGEQLARVDAAGHDDRARTDRAAVHVRDDVFPVAPQHGCGLRADARACLGGRPSQRREEGGWIAACITWMEDAARGRALDGGFGRNELRMRASLGARRRARSAPRAVTWT